MAIEDFSINGREHSVLAFVFEKGGTFKMVQWTPETETWEPSGVETLPDRYVVNLPASITLTELENIGGEYERAYEGMDYLRHTLGGTEMAGTKRWHELIVTHETNHDWLTSHSGDLT